MSHETTATLQKSLNSIHNLRRRVYLGGWIVVVVTLGLYGRLGYLHQTTDDVERLLGASVTALTCVIAWAAFAIILVVTRATKSILRAIDLSSHRSG